MIERIQRLPVLVLVTFRPEFEPPWTAQSHVTALMISRLGRRDGAALVAPVTGGRPLPAEIVRADRGAHRRRAALRRGADQGGARIGPARGGGDAERPGPLPPLAIPSTLHDSLMARLDRLAAAKEVAQVGAVIGREFPYRLLAAVARRRRPS